MPTIPAKMNNTSVNVLPSPEALGLSVARRIQQIFTQTNQRFHIAVSGGQTPRHIFKALCLKPLASEINWSNVNVYFTDERYVHHTHPESNYGMVKREFFSKLNINSDQIHPIQTHFETPMHSAIDYANLLTKEIPSNNDIPQFDLILLGIGTDGHIASLFPNTPVSDIESSIVTATKTPKNNQPRITLTYKLINHAKKIFVFACGKEKTDIIAHALNATQNHRLPVDHLTSHIEWFIDQEAAAY